MITKPMITTQGRLLLAALCAAALISCASGEFGYKRHSLPQDVFNSLRDAYGCVGCPGVNVNVHSKGYGRSMTLGWAWSMIGTSIDASNDKELLQNLVDAGLEEWTQDRLETSMRSSTAKLEDLSMRGWIHLPKSGPISAREAALLPGTYNVLAIDPIIELFGVPGDETVLRLAVQLRYITDHEGRPSARSGLLHWRDLFICDSKKVATKAIKPESVKAMVRSCVDQLEPWIQMELNGISSRTRGLKMARLRGPGPIQLTGHVLLDDEAWIAVRGAYGATYVMPREDARVTYTEVEK